jgi:hypothetical protein
VGNWVGGHGPKYNSLQQKQQQSVLKSLTA